ncbi:MAG: hypothetical protein ACI92E_001973 [Oceanicoccus sp.]|jgi:hypothetical protein
MISAMYYLDNNNNYTIIKKDIETWMRENYVFPASLFPPLQLKTMLFFTGIYKPIYSAH